MVCIKRCILLFTKYFKIKLEAHVCISCQNVPYITVKSVKLMV